MTSCHSAVRVEAMLLSEVDESLHQQRRNRGLAAGLASHGSEPGLDRSTVGVWIVQVVGQRWPASERVSAASIWSLGNQATAKCVAFE